MHAQQNSSMQLPPSLYKDSVLREDRPRDPCHRAEWERSAGEKRGSGAKTEVTRKCYLLSASTTQQLESSEREHKNGRGGRGSVKKFDLSFPLSSRCYDRVVTATPVHIHSPARPARSLQPLQGKAPKEHCLVLLAETTAAGSENYCL